LAPQSPAAAEIQQRQELYLQHQPYRAPAR